MRSLALAAFVLGGTLPSFAKDKLPGFDSPEKAFHAYCAGVVSEDFDISDYAREFISNFFQSVNA